MNRKGSVILHVLVTGVIIAVIAAGLLRMTMMNYAASARVSQGSKSRAAADEVLAKAVHYWTAANNVCSDFTTDGGEIYTCSGDSPVNTCDTSGCTCTSSIADRPTITVAAKSGGVCAVTIATQDND